MVRRRLIARLDIKGPNVIKGIQMEGLRVLGKPSEFARKYYEEGADELVLIDTVASLYGRDNLKDVVEQAANELFIPLTVGGGIRSMDDAKSMLMSGADKVAVNSGAIRNPALISDISRVFGSQCVVLSIEAKEVSPGRWESYIDNGREPTGLDVRDWCQTAVKLGAGEILLTSVDRDGTKRGYDLRLVQEVCDIVRVPVIASGGAGKASDLEELFSRTHADGAAIGTTLHYGTLGIREVKNVLSRHGIPVRQESA